MLLQALSRSLAVAGAHAQAFTFIALAPNTTRNTDTHTDTHHNHDPHTTHEDRHREREEIERYAALFKLGNTYLP